LRFPKPSLVLSKLMWSMLVPNMNCSKGMQICPR
jgi:hypothetical protein